MQIKTTMWGITSNLLEWLFLKVKKQQEMYSKGTQCTVGGNVSGYSHCGKQHESFSKN